MVRLPPVALKQTILPTQFRGGLPPFSCESSSAPSVSWGLHLPSSRPPGVMFLTERQHKSSQPKAPFAPLQRPPSSRGNSVNHFCVPGHLRVYRSDHIPEKPTYGSRCCAELNFRVARHPVLETRL